MNQTQSIQQIRLQAKRFFQRGFRKMARCMLAGIGNRAGRLAIAGFATSGFAWVRVGTLCTSVVCTAAGLGLLPVLAKAQDNVLTGVSNSVSNSISNNERSASDRPKNPLASNEPAFSQLTSTVAAIEASSNSLEILLKPLPNQLSAPVVTAMSASHDGKYLAIAGDDHVIRLFDVVTQKTVRELVGHTDWIQSLVFSADSQSLYSGGNDGRVLCWEHAYPVAPKEVVKLGFAIRSLSLATERQLLAIGGFSDDLMIWDLVHGTWKHRFKCDCDDQRCVRFSPDGKRLLCGGREGDIRVWEVESGELIFNKRLHRTKVFTAAFSVDGEMLTSAGEDRHLIRYDLKSDQIKLDREIATTKLMSLCLVNDQLVAVAGSDNSIRLYDVLADAVIANLHGHFGTVAVMCPVGDSLASGSFDTTVRIWDLEAEVGQQSKLSMPVGLAPLDVDARMRIR